MAYTSFTVPRGSRGTHTMTVAKKSKTPAKTPRNTPTKKSGKSPKKPVGPPPDPYKSQIDALTKLRFGGEESALKQKQRNIPAWFGGYQQRIAEAAKATQAYYAGAQQGNQQAIMQAAQGPNLGPGVSADVQAQSQLAGQSRASMQGAFGQTLGAAGAAESSFLQNQGVVGQAAQLGQQAGAQQALQDLATQKASYSVQARADLEKQAAQNDMERQALGLKTKAEQDKVDIANKQSQDKAAQRRATSRNARRQRQSTARENQANRDARAQQDAADRASREKIAKQREVTARAKEKAKAKKLNDPYPKKQSNTALERLDTASADYHRFSNTTVEEDLGGGKKRTRKPTRDEIIARLREEHYSQSEIHLALKEEWGPAEVRMAHRLGIRVKDSGRKVHHPLKTPPKGTSVNPGKNPYGG